MPLRISIGLVVGSLCVLAACASDAREPAAAQTSGGEVDENEALARAQVHPVAQPPERPLYPEKEPPPLPTASAPSEATTASTEAALEASPPPERVVAPHAPPAPRDEIPPPAPEPTYVWAPGYWYWYGGDYVWIAGGWLPPRHGYRYASAGWVYGDVGWIFWPGGWATAGTSVVVYPVYRHHYLYYYPGRPHSRYSHHPHVLRPSHRGVHRYPSRAGSRSYRGGTTRTVMRRR